MKMLSMLPKKSLSILTTLAYLSFVAAPASAANFDKSLEDDLIKICEAVKSDSKLKLNRLSEKYHIFKSKDLQFPSQLYFNIL